MCIQRHPCKYKCFENYSALFQSFPVFQHHNPGFDCGCKKKPNFDFNQNQNINLGNYNFFNCMEPQKCKNKFRFCVQGSIKLDGSC